MPRSTSCDDWWMLRQPECAGGAAKEKTGHARAYGTEQFLERPVFASGWAKKGPTTMIKRKKTWLRPEFEVTSTGFEVTMYLGT